MTQDQIFNLGEIFPPDWSQFVSDTLSSLCTSALVGVIVGLLLWRWQRRFETKTIKRSAMASWKIARSSVALALAEPFSRENHAQDLERFAMQIQPIIDEGRKYPVGEWSEALPENEEVRSLSKILEVGPTMQRLSNESKALLRSAFSRENLVMQGYEGPFVIWASIEILDVPNPERILNLPAEGYEPIVKQVLAMSDVAVHTANFRVVVREVELSYGSLRSSLVAG